MPDIRSSSNIEARQFALQNDIILLYRIPLTPVLRPHYHCFHHPLQFIIIITHMSRIFLLAITLSVGELVAPPAVQYKLDNLLQPISNEGGHRIAVLRAGIGRTHPPRLQLSVKSRDQEL